VVAGFGRVSYVGSLIENLMSMGRMKENPLRVLWREGRTAVNGWLTIPTGHTAEVMANQGWDSVTVDTQHGLIHFDTALECLRAISTTNAVPLARPPWNEPGMIMKLLDAGALGVICPMINTPEEAAELVSYCRFAHDGGARSFGPTRALMSVGTDYVQNSRDLVLVIGMIETQQALESVENIAATPGLDGLYIGPGDLSLSLGLTPHQDSRDPVMVEAQERILAAAKSNGLIAGIHNASGPYAHKMGDKGFDLVTVSNDTRLLAAAAKAAVTAARGEDGPGSAQAGSNGGY